MKPKTKNIMMLTFSIPLILICVLIFTVTILPWLLIGFHILFSEDPKVPEIKYEEFPFRVEYEIDGEVKVIEDTLICKYDGIGGSEGSMGKYLKFKTLLKSTGTEPNMKMNELVISKDALSIEGDLEYLVRAYIYIYPGSAEYYIGNTKDNKNTKPSIRYEEQISKNGFISGTYSAEELYEKYKIKIISWEFSEPIKNNFKDTLFNKIFYNKK